jgi:hypothetical protein
MQWLKHFYRLMHFIILCMCKCIKPLIDSLVKTIQAVHSLHIPHFTVPYVHSLPHCSDPMLTWVNIFLRKLR